MGIMKIKFLFLASLVVGLTSCGGSQKEGPKDGPATGSIAIGVDESFQPLVNAEKAAFEENYHFAKLNLVFKPENESIADLLNDKVRSVVVSRELTDSEKEIFAREKITYRSFKFAADGIALIVNKANSDTLITLDQLNSSNIKFLVDRFGLGNSGLAVAAAGSNKAVVEYVQSHKNAVGIIGSNWISDGDNPTSLGFIRSVHVMSVSENGKDYFQPFGYNLALKKYPLRREIKMILKESHSGLGTGFVNYVCGDMGQLIVLKAGLIPLTRPITIRQYQISQ
jgi:phosphate transport system substrate-binding protein